MRQVPVTMAWLINSFENSSEHSEYYLDLQNGDVKYYSPMDFPEHEDLIKRMDRYPERYARLPKLEKELILKINKEFTEKVEDPDLKSLLMQALSEETRFRRIMMGYGDARRKWYKLQNERYGEFLKDWFKERGLELVDRPPRDVLDYNK